MRNCIDKRFERLGIMFIFCALCTSTLAADMLWEERTREWVVRYVRQPLPESSRKARYLDLINRYSEDFCGVDENWFLETCGAETVSSRDRTNAVARLAFSYHTPGARHYQNPAALATLRKAFHGVVPHVNREGRFTWETELNDYGYESQQHEHAWRVEPLLLAYIWICNDLSPKERSDIEGALWRSAQWLYDHPKTETNNRGMVWTAVLTLAGIFFEEPTWIKKVEEHADEILRAIILEGGEIGENTEQYAGGGPDANYTYTSLSYIYMYHLWSGKTAMDVPIQNAMRWLVGYTTLSGWPVVVGASVRTGNVNPSNIQDCLPYCERLSKEEPLYALLAENILSKMEDLRISPWKHIVSPTIWAMMEAGVEVHSAQLPTWETNRTSLYSRPHVHYALLSRQCQTGVTFRARLGSYDPLKSNYRNIPTGGMPLRGLQVWAWGQEYPIILHAKDGAQGGFSFTQAGGVNTAKTDVSKNAETGEWEIDLKTQSVPGWDSDLAVIVARRESLWTLYALTPLSTVVVYGGPDGPYKTSWYMNRSYLQGHSIDVGQKAVRFDGREGTLYFLKGAAISHGDRVEIHTQSGPVAFGFSNGSFHFGDVNVFTETVGFSDASGSYLLDLRRILKNGNINRSTNMRLAVFQAASLPSSK